MSPRRALQIVVPVDALVLVLTLLSAIRPNWGGSQARPCGLFSRSDRGIGGASALPTLRQSSTSPPARGPARDQR